MKLYLAGFGKGDADRLKVWALKVYLCQGTAPNQDRLDETMFDPVVVARALLIEELRELLLSQGVRCSSDWLAKEVRLYLVSGQPRDSNGSWIQIHRFIDRWREERQHLKLAEVAERLKIYLVSGGTGAPDGPSARLFKLLAREPLRQELVAALRERFGGDPDLAQLEELVRIYLCSTHSNDAAPLETQRNGSLGQLGRLGELMKLFLCTWPHGAGGDPRDISKSMKIFLSTGRAYRPGDLDDMGLSAKTRVSPFKRPIRLLLSYHYYKANDLDALLKECFDGVPIDIFADSGAYSAASLGEKVDPQEYIKWVEKWQHHFSAVSAPDVIGDAVASTRETEAMLKAGLTVKVLPVYHVGEPWDYLHYWNDRPEIDYMALGGMVPYRKDRRLLLAWLRKCFSILRPSMRVHGFGMTAWPDLVRWPWYSADSSSWTSGFRFARLKLFDDVRGEMDEVNMRDGKELLLKRPLIQSYGLASAELVSQTYDRDVLCGVCVESWQRAEAWLEANQQKIRAQAAQKKGGPS